MSMFTYQGRNTEGTLIQGKIDAENSNAVADQLIGDGITPLEISPLSQKKNNGEWTVKWQEFFAEKVALTDLLLFSRQMHTLIKAGIPILRALEGLKASTPNKTLSAMLQGIRHSLDAGHQLYASLSYYPKTFSPFYVSMIRVGEMTGSLDKVFLQLYYYLEFEHEMRQRIKSALRYPSFVILAMAVAMVVINIFVIPTFAKVFDGFNAELPLMTQILIGFSDFMVESWPLLLATTAVIIVGIQFWLTTERGERLWDKHKLGIPLFGKIILKATLAKFSRSFALAYKSGVPIVQAMAVVAQVVDNKYIGEHINQMRSGIERGESFYRTASNSNVFTPMVLQMIAVGEETGELDTLMEEIAAMYEREVEYEVRTLSQQIEPILIVALGAMVLVLALGIFLPIWDLGSVAIK